MNVLVLNSGSSSLHLQLIATDPGRIQQNKDERLCHGKIEGIGGDAVITIRTRSGQRCKSVASIPDTTAALEYMGRWITSHSAEIPEVRSISDIHAVGHRVLHGGERFTDSTMITDEVLKGIEECIELAPLHNPNAIRGILAARQVFGPLLPQVATFETSFHHSMSEQAYLYALPYHFYLRHQIRRYGFHGISHRYVVDRYSAFRGVSKERVNIVTLHLGNGCSATAVRRGRSADTSMGMTPLEGLVMGTRSGDIDPGIISLISTKEGLSAFQVEAILNTQSGLLGLSGLTSDMRVLEMELKQHGDRRARLAIEIFCYRAKKYIGALLAAMGGADAIVFTGGIGENSADIRARICAGFEWAGLMLDERKNEQTIGAEGQITKSESRLHAFVIPADEELLIARDTVRCVANQQRTAPLGGSSHIEQTHMGLD